MKLALKSPELNDKGLAKSIDYGAPFAELYRSWLHKTGIAEMGLPLQVNTDPAELELLTATDKDNYRRLALKALVPWESEAAQEKAYQKASNKLKS